MRKSDVTAIVVASGALLLICGIGILFCVRALPQLLGRVRSDAPIEVSTPKGVCKTSVAVFNFRPHGGVDAKYYAIGFARALADRTYCAPDHITQQPTASEIGNAICQAQKDPTVPISDALALKLAKGMGAEYVITGDLTRTGANASLSICVRRTRTPSRKHVFTSSGDIAALPRIQVAAAKEILSAMNVRFSRPELQRPNFSRPETIRLYGQSLLAGSRQQSEALRWSAVDGDLTASFPVIRILEYYGNGPFCCAELRNNRRLSQLLGRCSRDFAGNSHIGVLRAMVLLGESEYEQAEKALEGVTASDPDMIFAHSMLAYVARLRQNGEMAVREATTAANAWPNNPYAHSFLADSYSTAAANARRGRYYGQMSYAAERKWRDCCNKALQEAYVATRLNPDCSSAWFTILDTSLQLSRYTDRDRAYRELTRLEPTNEGVYTTYAFCLSRRRGGTDAQQERVFADADRAFPRGSCKPLVIRALSLISDFDPSSQAGGPYDREILRLCDEISRKAGEKSLDAIRVRYKIYELHKQREELLKTSEYAFGKWGGLEWEYNLGTGYAFAYEDKRDIAYLEKARRLFADCVEEVPLDPRSHVQLGWCLSHQGKRAEAKAQFLKALEIDPSNEAAREKLQYVQ